METLQHIFFPTQFIPHGHCYLWQPELVWLHLLSDVLIAISYYSIPIMLVYFVRKRKDIPFPGIFLLFGLFITTCGTTHLMSVWTLWHPAYWLSGTVKAITALVSIYTALALFPTIPAALALPSPDKLWQINQQLGSEIDERKQAELALQKQLQLGKIISELSSRFINLDPDNTDTEINHALKVIGQLAGVDTSYIFRCDPSDNTLNMTHEWVAEGNGAQIENTQKMPQSAFPWALSCLLRGEVLIVSDVSDVPSEAMVDSQNWQQFGLQSILTIPLMTKGEPWGAVGFASFHKASQWTDANIQFLKVFAEILFRAQQRQQSELALRCSEERWQLALQGTSDGIWDWNVETDEVFYSPRFKQMLGYEEDEFPNKTEEWENRVHPDDIQQVWAAVKNHFDQKTPAYRTEHRVRCKDGSYKWILDRAKALRDETGKVIRMTGSHTDITDRKQAEAELKQLNQELEARVEMRTAALQESERRFRSLFESAPDFIYVLDRHSIIHQVNPAVIDQSGYHEADLLGQPLTKFLSKKTQLTCQQEFSTLLSTGSHRQEMEFVCKDGRILIMDCSCTLVKESPSEGYILVLQRDTTARKKAEEERQQLLATVQRSEQRWRSFLDNVRLMVVGLDASGVINYVNPHFLSLMGYQRQDIEGKNGFDTLLLPQYERQHQQDFFQSLLEDQAPSHYQNSVLTCCDQEEKIIAWNTTVLKDSQGLSTGILSIGEDITERYAVDRMKDEFISVVSHELRTPLTSIHGALDLVTSGLVKPESDRGQHVLAIAAENSSRLVQLVNDILELERLESGKMKLHQTLVSTLALTQRAYELMELMAERADIQIEMTEIDLVIWADGDRLIQVLTNLLSNAIKFSETSSTVWVMVEELVTLEGSHVKFTVQDRGRGIPPNKLGHIFERFHQVDASDSRSKEGTGLGLAICRSIVQQHEGTIWAESTMGEGSSFFFTIPTSCQVPF